MIKEDIQMENKHIKISGKCKLKQYKIATTHLEWPKSGILTTNAGEDVKQ